MIGAINAGDIDYSPCSYGQSRLSFRGPRKSLDRPYIAVIGGSEGYGRFVRTPFSDLLEKRLGIPVVNLSCMHAGLTAFQDDATVLDVASGAILTVVQVMGAENMSNRYYTVHPRRNDRFLAASDKMTDAFPDVDFTDFHFTRHLLTSLEEMHQEAFADLAKELRTAWLHRMRGLLRRIQSPSLLLWMSTRQPEISAQSAWDASPMLVDAEMLDDIRKEVLDIVCVDPSPAEKPGSLDGKVYAEDEQEAAQVLPGPKFHANAACALEAVIQPIFMPKAERQIAAQ